MPAAHAKRVQHDQALLRHPASAAPVVMDARIVQHHREEARSRHAHQSTQHTYQLRQAQQPKQAQHMQQVQRAASKDYNALPRPSPYPLEGDIIAYRLLHISADWTPQVALLTCSHPTTACMKQSPHELPGGAM